MSSITRVLFALMVTCVVPLPLMAETMPRATVDYSADSYMQAQGMTINSRVYHSLNKDRVEMSGSGGNSIIINRLDKKVGWVLMPEQKMYMEVDLNESRKNSNDMSDCRMSQKMLGSETVNGFKTTKSRINMTCPDNKAYEGLMWVTKEGIVMKMDTVAKTDDGDVALKIELRNLKIGRQNPKLFELPAGYSSMNFGGLMKGMSFSGDSPSRGRKVDKYVGDDEGGRSYTAKPRGRNNSRGRSYTAAPRDNGRSYTSQSRDEGRSYTSSRRDEGRSYTSSSRDDGRSYTAQPRRGRSYTAEKRRRGPADPVGDSVNKLKNFFGL